MARYFDQDAEVFFAVLGLLLFLMVFVSVFIGALRRPQEQVDRLSAMPLEIHDEDSAVGATGLARSGNGERIP